MVLPSDLTPEILIGNPSLLLHAKCTFEGDVLPRSLYSSIEIIKQNLQVLTA